MDQGLLDRSQNKKLISNGSNIMHDSICATLGDKNQCGQGTNWCLSGAKVEGNGQTKKEQDESFLMMIKKFYSDISLTMIDININIYTHTRYIYTSNNKSCSKM